MIRLRLTREGIRQTGRVVDASADTVDGGSEAGGTRSFLPAVEGMRACAAIGVVITHVAFQTGHTTGVLGRFLGRFDLAVAVFFALSGFLLWRGHAAAARGLRETPADRALPAVQDRAHHAGLPGRRRGDPVVCCPTPARDLTVWLANLTLTQIYVPLTLTAGLTQMWSLSVEVTFYLALPFLALRRGGCRSARESR